MATPPLLHDLPATYVDLVYAAALRQTRHDPHMAADVTQAVFLIMMKKGQAHRLPEEAHMAGWLLKVTHYAVKEARRAAQRRARHEAVAAMNAAAEENRAPANLNDITGELDRALLKLGTLDREVLVRRYLQDQPVASVAIAVGMTENSAGHRIGRALEKLRKIITRRGVAAPAAALIAVLAAESAKAAPPALLASAAAAAGGTSTAAAGIAKGASVLMWAKAAKTTAAVAAALLVTTSVAVALREKGPEPAVPVATRAAVTSAPVALATATAPEAPISDAPPPVLVGLFDGTHPEKGWWNGEGTPIKDATLDKEKITEPGIVAAFRLDSAESAMHLYYSEFDTSRSPKRSWRSADGKVVYSLLSVPAAWRMGNLLVFTSGTARKDLFAVPLAGEASLGIHTATAYGLAGFAAYREKEASEFGMTVFHGGDQFQQRGLEGERFVLRDRAGNIHVTLESAVINGRATELRFGIPLKEAATLVRQIRPETQYYFRGVALQPGVAATPLVTSAKDQKTAKAEDIALLRYHATPSLNTAVGVVASGRVIDGRLKWWSPDGEEMYLKGVMESDVSKPGTIVAIKQTGALRMPTQMIDGKPVTLPLSALWAEGLMLLAVDPTGKQQSTDLTVESYNAGNGQQVVAQVPYTVDDLGREKAGNTKDVISLSGLERTSPKSFRFKLRHTFEPGVDFMTIDKDGKMHERVGGAFGKGYAEIMFDFPVDDLAAFVVTSRTTFTIAISGISLQPGIHTQPRFSITQQAVRQTAPENEEPKIPASVEVRGIIKAPDGTPVEGARVVPSFSSHLTNIQNNLTRSNDPNNVTFLSAADGTFVIPAESNPHRKWQEVSSVVQGLVILHDKGFAVVSAKDFAAAKEIKLRPWATIKGRYVADKAPDVGAKIVLDYSPNLPGGDAPWIMLDYQSTTDEEGRFVFPQVPEMQLATLGREVILAKNKQSTWISMGPSIQIETQGGKTLEVTLGGTGRAVTGALKLPAWWPETMDWTTAYVTLQRQPSEIPLSPDSLPAGAYDEVVAQWKQSPEGKAYQKGQWRGVEVVKEDGTFRMPDVPPGHYLMTVQAERHGPGVGGSQEVAWLRMEIAVPEGEGPAVDVGTREIKMVSMPQGEGKTPDQSSLP